MAALSMLVFRPPTETLWCVGPVVGLCLGPAFATARVLLVELSPKDQLAEMMGLAGLCGKAASILGSLIWGVLVLKANYQAAVAVMIVLIGIGVFLLRRVPERVVP
jgi:UMF1 family MFS transporter